jgi:hypothetical protein
VFAYLKTLINLLFGEAFVRLSIGTRSLDILLIKAASVYLKMVDAARQSLIKLVLIILMMMLLMVGFVAVHIGVFILTGWTMTTIGIVAISLGVVYMLFSGILIFHLTSEKTWMKVSKGTEIVQKVTKARSS